MTVGLLVQMAAYVLVPREMDLARQIVGFGAGGLLIAGGAITASSKGYSPWMGLLGVLSFVGMGIILLVPNKATLFPKKRRAPDEGGSEKS